MKLVLCVNPERVQLLDRQAVVWSVGPGRKEWHYRKIADSPSQSVGVGMAIESLQKKLEEMQSQGITEIFVEIGNKEVIQSMLPVR